MIWIIILAYEFEEGDQQVPQWDIGRRVRFRNRDVEEHHGTDRSVTSYSLSLMTLKIIKDDRLYNYIQEEYEKCLSINSFIHNKIRSTEEAFIKKWGNKQQVSKWKKKEEPK